MAANLEDLHRWSLALRNGTILSPEGRKRLLGPQHTLRSGTGVGYGWFLSPTPAGTVEHWSRGGEDFGHNAVIRWFPSEELLIIVQSNAGVFEGQEANRTISSGILKCVFPDWN